MFAILIIALVWQAPNRKHLLQALLPDTTVGGHSNHFVSSQFIDGLLKNSL